MPSAAPASADGSGMKAVTLPSLTLPNRARYRAACRTRHPPCRACPSSYLAERHRDLVAGTVAEGAAEGDAVILADACVDAARRIMTELLAHRAGVPKGRA